MELPFDLNILESMATPGSFARGEEYYYDHAVKHLVYNGHTFTARVLGSYAYHVEISGTKTSPHFQCSCPYDYEGICKHIVAVGLAILHGDFETEVPEYTVVLEEDTTTQEQFQETFKHTSDEIKMNFLRQVLAKDAQLQMQFIKYTAAMNPQETTAAEVPATDPIEKIRDEITLHLASLTFNEEDLFEPGYYDAGGYYDEGEAAYEEAQKLIREVFEPYEKRAEACFRHGEVVKGMHIVLGMYEGKFAVTEPAEDPLYVVEEQYPETIDAVLKEILDSLFALLKSVVKSPAEVKAAINLLFSRYQYYEKHMNDLSTDTEEEDVYAIYYLKDFESWFFAVITEQDTARFLLDRLREEDLIDVDTAFVVLQLAEHLEDEHLWLTTANEFALYEVEIAKKLLDKYQRLRESGEFLRVAQQSFQQFPDQIDEYLATHLPDDTQLDFYKKVHLHLIRRTHQIAYYHAIRTYLSEAEKDSFIQSMGLTYDHLFYVKLLALEERYADILKRVQQQMQDDYQFDQLITPIIHVYPQECFTMLRQKCMKAIEQRGRHVYQMIVRWLQLMRQIKGFETETIALIQQLYHHKPNLPALKDEMRMAKLV